MREFGGTTGGDAAIIFAGQAAEHYQITRYPSLRAFAEILKYKDAKKIIEDILEQEKAADEKLTSIAEDRVDLAAAQEDENSIPRLRHRRRMIGPHDASGARPTSFRSHEVGPHLC